MPAWSAQSSADLSLTCIESDWLRESSHIFGRGPSQTYKYHVTAGVLASRLKAPCSLAVHCGSDGFTSVGFGVLDAADRKIRTRYLLASTGPRPKFMEFSLP